MLDTLLRLGYADEMSNLIADLLNKNPHDDILNVYSGWADVLRGDTKEGIRQFEKAGKINPNNDSVSTFIKNHDCTSFDFYGSIFSLYLSRIDRLDGCFLKTIIPRKSNLESFDKTTFLKINVTEQKSFNDLLNESKSTFRDALNHSEIDVGNYLDENVSYYFHL